MKKILALAVVAAFLFALPTLAGEEKKGEKMMAKGTISAWNESDKTFTLKDESGKEMSFMWKENSQKQGMGKPGEMAMVKYTMEKDGKMLANHIWIGQEEIAKAEKSMQDKKTEKAGSH